MIRTPASSAKDRRIDFLWKEALSKIMTLPRARTGKSMDINHHSKSLWSVAPLYSRGASISSPHLAATIFTRLYFLPLIKPKTFLPLNARAFSRYM